MAKLSKSKALAYIDEAIDGYRVMTIEWQKEYDPKNLLGQSGPRNYRLWADETCIALGYIFGEGSRQQRELKKARSDLVMSASEFPYGKKEIGILFTLRKEVEKYWDDDTLASAPSLPKAHYSRVDLLWDMDRIFDTEEIRTICFEMNIDYEHLRGDEKSSLIRELILYCERNGNTEELLAAINRHRPSFPERE
jgi:hypothetical protein